MNCHEQDFLSAGVPQHKQPKTDCLTCHSGHGGPDRKFLKPNWKQMAASQPTGGGQVH
jgi:predicted CXXCH cytochrome family protein